MFRQPTRFRIALVSAIFCFANTLARGEDWPTWQHDNRRTGVSAEQLPAKLQLIWTRGSTSPPQPAWHGPAKYDAYAYHFNLPSMRNYDAAMHVIAVGDRVWFGSPVDDSLTCLDANTGSELWHFTTGAPVRLAPTWYEGRVYFGSDDGFARCVDAKSGQLVWQFSPTARRDWVLNNGRFIAMQPCRTGVTVADGTAWFACGLVPWEDSFLCALDAESGGRSLNQKIDPAGASESAAQAKAFHFVKSLRGKTIEGAPALSSTALIVPQGRVAPRVFDRTNGDDLGAMNKSGGGSVVVVTLDEQVLHGPGTDSRKGGFRKSDSKSREMVAALGRGNALVVDGTQSWMLTDDAIVRSNLTTSKEQWSVECDCPFAMIKAGQTLYVGGDQKIAAYDSQTGEKLWSQKTQGRIFSLAAARGKLFASSDLGVIHCFAAGSGSKNETAAQRNDLDLTGSKGDTSVAEIQPVEDKRLLGHWAFHESALSGGKTLHALKGQDLDASGALRFSRGGDFQFLELDGRKDTLMLSPNFREVAHPKNHFTVTASVRIDQLQEWGGIAGIVQDNGSDEKGWLLGYRKDRFSFALNGQQGPDRLMYLTAQQPFELKQWNHVAACYDGSQMRLIVNGEVVATSDQQSGPIAYPDRGWFELAAYHDKNEYYRLKGALQEVRIYDDALSVDEVREQYQQAKARMPKDEVPAKLKSGPWLTFADPQSAVVRWSTFEAVPTCLEHLRDGERQRFYKSAAATSHEVRIGSLRHNQLSLYRIGLLRGDDFQFTSDQECDNFFNFTRPVVSVNEASASGKYYASATRILKESPAERGQCLLVGDVDVELVQALVRSSQLRFVVVSDEAHEVALLRQHLRAAGIYGDRVTVRLASDLASLDLPANWANLAVVFGRSEKAVVQEAMRQTCPDGGVALLWEGDEIRSRFEKEALTGAGAWTHLYGRPNNAAFGGERLGEADASDQLAIQWIGRPGPRYQADRSGRKPSPLCASGRLFLQGLHRMIALDIFNGTVLWSLEIPQLERFNLPRDCSNWCCDERRIYAAIESECWVIDSATGEVEMRLPVRPDEANDPAYDWGFVARSGDLLYGSEVRAGSSWTSFWGGGDEGWYDARGGAVTHPICSDALFGRDAVTLEKRWRYEGGIILNPTITITEDTIYFVECRDAEVLSQADRRVGNPRLWQALHLVALDSTTGQPKWERPLRKMPPQVVLYLAHAANQLTLVASADGKYQVDSLSEIDGQLLWTREVDWPGGKGDHGKAMMRPAVVDGRIFLRPHVLSLADGAVLPQRLPDGHGCGTYACSAKAVFYRAKTVTMWSPEKDQRSTWQRLRPDCWLSTIPAGGMLLSPEGGGGCSCGSWMETSIGFIPRVFREAVKP